MFVYNTNSIYCLTYLNLWFCLNFSKLYGTWKTLSLKFLLCNIGPCNPNATVNNKQRSEAHSFSGVDCDIAMVIDDNIGINNTTLKIVDSKSFRGVGDYYLFVLQFTYNYIDNEYPFTLHHLHTII